MDGSLYEIGDIVDHLKLHAGRQLSTQFRKLASDVVCHAHSVGARLPQDLNGDNVLCRSSLSKKCRPGSQFLCAVFDLRYIADAHRRAATCPDHDFTELFRGRDAT